MSNKNLRKKIKKLMVDLEFDKPSRQRELASELDTTEQILSMALTGYRQTERYQKLLNDLYELLKNKRVNKRGQT
jgi:Uma2 family endonuclease